MTDCNSAWKILSVSGVPLPRKGIPVANKASLSWRRPDTRMRRSFTKAPLPASAKKHSLRAGSNTMPAVILLPSCTAIEIAKCGIPCMKLVVPSIGSIIHCGASLSWPAICPDSSMTNPQSGRALANSSWMTFSAVISALVTKSAAPLRLT